jgi:hypothetical protein
MYYLLRDEKSLLKISKGCAEVVNRKKKYHGQQKKGQKDKTPIYKILHKKQ